MEKSKLKQHTFDSKEKKLKPPFIALMGDKLSLQNWSKERMPNYIWLALLRNSCDRKEFFEKMYIFKKNIEENIPEFDSLSFSAILKLEKEKKVYIYNKIKELFGENILDPLIIVSNNDNELRNCFYLKTKTNDTRIKEINKIVDEIYNRHSIVSLDIRYLIIVFNKKIVVQSGLTGTAETLNNYPYTSFDSPKMEMYTAFISSLEIALQMTEKGDDLKNYSNYFFEEMYSMTDCKLYFIDYPKDDEEGKERLIQEDNEIVKIISGISEFGISDKMDIIMGSLTYIHKIVSEIINSNLNNSIISRIAIRTVLETFINLKYMILVEKTKKEIWGNFKEYGSGVCKNVYKRIEEKKVFDKPEVHIEKNLLKVLANEIKDEEFTCIDFSNFDDKNFRQKFIAVNEEDLYQIYYNYDSSFSHSYWNAIRESSMLLCDNPLHNYHSMPDVNYQQKLKSIYSDLAMILNKLRVLCETEIGVGKIEE